MPHTQREACVQKTYKSKCSMSCKFSHCSTSLYLIRHYYWACYIHVLVCTVNVYSSHQQGIHIHCNLSGTPPTCRCTSYIKTDHTSLLPANEAFCGNGILEENEECDGDPCCDNPTCTLLPGFRCRWCHDDVMRCVMTMCMYMYMFLYIGMCTDALFTCAYMYMYMYIHCTVYVHMYNV